MPYYPHLMPSWFLSQVSQLDFLMLLAADHLDVIGVKSSTWEVPAVYVKLWDIVGWWLNQPHTLW